MEIDFFPKAEEDLEFWRKSGNKQVQKKISALIEDIKKTPFEGLGQPEALKYDLFGKWSRRITAEHRMLYKVHDNRISLFSLRGHYEK